MFGKLMPKKSGIKTKKNRIRRRFTDFSGDFLAASVLLTATIVLSLTFIYFYSFLISIPYFQIKEVSVRGLKELTEKDILTSADIKPAQSLLAVNTDAVIRRVSANQWVENVYVGRELPGKLVLEVRERTPMALVKQADDFYLMDVKGFVFKRLGKSDAVDLPVITGITSREQTHLPLLLSTLQLLKTLSTSTEYSYVGTIAEINIDDVFGISLVSNNCLYLKLGTDDFENKLKKLRIVLADLENRGMKTGYLCIDLSDQSKVTVKRKSVPEKTEQGDKGKQYLI
ncbi:MAG: FtsQ-type POTRA domain-containing protein [Deltaproteobacteria bacterium]|nr:FtsQ-type POTRA domain-containing protein [Deltaproteobacteria bacterium]